MIGSPLASLLDQAAAHEIPPAPLVLRIARAYELAGQPVEAARWGIRVVDADEDFTSWQGAAGLLDRTGAAGLPFDRTVRMAILGSSNTSQLTSLIPLVGARYRIGIETYECDYGQYRQEIVDPDSGLYAFGPDVVLIAVHDGDVAVPSYSDDPVREIETEMARWTGLWRVLRERSSATILQFDFAQPPETPFGHLGASLVGSRFSMTRVLNHRLASAAGNGIAVVDCEWLSSVYGKAAWFDRRYWYLAKQAVALGAIPRLARHTVGVLAAQLGLTRKCLVLDLDNTLWGGVIAEDGLEGIRLGDGPQGEAFVAFQEYLLRLKERGVLLAVCSKNDDAVAREPFERHPAMRIRLEDIAVFVASWEAKPDGVRHIASSLNIGTDALVFVDDNPAEREAMRSLLPQVEVITLPEDPAEYVSAVAANLVLEPASFTPEDAARTQQYRARAELSTLEATASSLDDFLASLDMVAKVEPFDALSLPRVAQLIGKTNQFNLTTRRHSLPELQAFVVDPSCEHFSMRLADRLTDHGLISVMIAFQRGAVMEIDTWLMSCRVIGRSVEQSMIAELAARARTRGCTALNGTYIPTSKNGMVEEVFDRLGFELMSREEGGTTHWSLPLDEGTRPGPSPFIKIVKER